MSFERATTQREFPAEDIFGNAKKLRFILDAVAAHRARLRRELAVLDFGCGNAAAVGRYLIAEGVRYIGVDIHAPSLNYARRHFAAPNASFREDVPPGARFDIIVYADILEHLHDPLTILKAHVAQLAGDGIVIGSVPNGYGPCEIEKFIDRHLHLYPALRSTKRAVLHALGRLPKAQVAVPYNSESGHVVFFTLSELRRMVRASGLGIVRFAHAGFIGADLTAALFNSARFFAWNARVSDRLPSWAVSAWHFVLARDGAPS